MMRFSKPCSVDQAAFVDQLGGQAMSPIVGECSLILHLKFELLYKATIPRGWPLLSLLVSGLRSPGPGYPFVKSLAVDAGDL